ncbi:hypothetical protein CK203_094089 [Vitis vinifera]|uniref:Uncharacterized protein n=1 Tax=Vitis vinifera TaxID=29760 RepID=A0A438CXK4_VITVI|nr:hypothetical protein CK203_094089 [Vitis vinifera]
MEAVAALSPTRFEGRHVWKESCAYAISLLAAIPAVHSMDLSCNGKRPTFDTALTAVRTTWKRPLVTVGTLPSEDTWHASCRDTWHASYSDMWHTLSSGSPSSESSYKAHMTRFSHPDCLKEEQTTLTKHRHPDGFH